MSGGRAPKNDNLWINENSDLPLNTCDFWQLVMSTKINK